MYILNEEYDHLDQLFNSLDNERAHDFMELLLSECSKKAGNDEFMIYVRNEKEIADLGITPNQIITRKMVDDAYRAVSRDQ